MFKKEKGGNEMPQTISQFVNEQQISLFDFMNEIENEKKMAVVETKTTTKKEKKGIKKEVPKIFDKIKELKTFEELLRYVPTECDSGKPIETHDVIIGFKRCRYSETGFSHSRDYKVVGNDLYSVPVGSRYNIQKIYIDKVNCNYQLNFIYFDEDGICWNMPIKIKLDHELYFFYYSNETIKCLDISFGKTSTLKKMISCYKYDNNERNVLLNSSEEIRKILKQTNPYGYKFVLERNPSPSLQECLNILSAPQIEQLYKAGYTFVEKIVDGIVDSKYVGIFNKLTQPGKNLKEIFKCSKTLYTALKDDGDLGEWDIYRKMEKQGKFTKDTLCQAIDMGYKDMELAHINTILNKKYKGKPVFTWDTLQNYLRRLDMYQAIGNNEAFLILTDYLRMCEELDVEPRTDSDSLKREHDVIARTLREKEDEIMAEKMKGACDYLSVNDYDEDIFFIRGIRDYADLIDEAKQQKNCVAGYAKSIINHNSLIYVMRRKDTPNTSLITVELSRDQMSIRQKFLAYNKPIHNKAQSEFLDRWLAKVRQRVKLGASSIKEMEQELNPALSVN